MDVLAEVFRAIKLDGAMYFTGEFSAPWSVNNPGIADFAPYLSKKTGHMVIFHTILEGKARIRLSDGQEEDVSAGSIVIFPHGDAHVVGNGQAGQTSNAALMLRNHVEGGITVVRTGGGGELTRVVCGFLVCDPHMGSMLLSGLPKLLVVPIKQGTAGNWIQHSIQFLVNAEQTGDPGRELVLSKLAEVLLLETLRQYVNDLPSNHESWFAGTRDPFIGKALAELHSKPEHPWTLVALGREVGLSRTRLAERFTKFVGRPPMTYLAEWRIQLGARLLTSGNGTVAEIAARVGYGSEASFCRAFKKELGVPPATFRRNQRGVARRL